MSEIEAKVILECKWNVYKKTIKKFLHPCKVCDISLFQVFTLG